MKKINNNKKICYNYCGGNMKSIVVNLRKESDLYERYNNDVSSNLIKYLISETNIKDDIEVIINTKLDVENIDGLIKKGLEDEYTNTNLIDKFYDNKQVRFFVLGALLLFVSSFLGYEVLKEFVLIIAWFAIYEFVEITFNINFKINKKRKAIKKLMNCKIKVNKI